jgi:hypothetical protein
MVDSTVVETTVVDSSSAIVTPTEATPDDAPSGPLSNSTVLVGVVVASSALLVAMACFIMKLHQAKAPKVGELTMDKNSLSTKSSLELQTSQRKHKKNPHAGGAGAHDVAFSPLNNGELDSDGHGQAKKALDGFKNPLRKKLRSKLGAAKNKLVGGGSSAAASKKGGKSGSHEARSLLSSNDQEDGAEAFAKELSGSGQLRLRPPTSKQRLSGEDYEEQWAALCEDEQEKATLVPARPQLRVRASGEARGAEEQVKAVSKALGSDVVLLAEGVVGANAKWYFYTYSNDCQGERTGGTLFMGGITAVVPISTISICCRSSDEAKLPRFLEMMRVRLATAS